jgi:hypothetical protein
MPFGCYLVLFSAFSEHPSSSLKKAARAADDEERFPNRMSPQSFRGWAHCPEIQPVVESCHQRAIAIGWDRVQTSVDGFKRVGCRERKKLARQFSFPAHGQAIGLDGW